MTFMGSLKELFNRQAEKHAVVRIPEEMTDAQYDPEPFSEGESYCRVWLVEMCLEKGVEWLKKRYPVVYSSVRFQHGGKEMAVPFIAGPDFLKTQTQKNYDRIIQLDHPLTPLFPFSHGLVEIQAGLFSMVAADWVNRFVNTLDRFSKLIRVPELSSAVKMVSPVVGGIEDLLGIGDRRLEIGYQQTFAGTEENPNRLRPGYFAVFRAEPAEISELDLGVFEERLCVMPGSSQSQIKPEPLAGYSYMLFRIEKNPNQNWEGLAGIKTLVDKMVEAMNGGKKKEQETIYQNLRLAVAGSSDITRAHRRRMWDNIKAYIRDSRLHGATSTDGSLSLYAIMQRNEEPSAETVEEIAELEAIFQPHKG